MARVIVLMALLCLSVFNVLAQSNKTFFLGHSLVNFHIPHMVDELSMAGSQSFSYDANIGIGASLSWHWNSPTSGQGDQWDLTLPDGGYEHFIMTEAVPLQGHLDYSGTYRIVDSLCTFANQYSPSIRYYIYETWHCINSGNGGDAGGGFPCSWDSGSNVPWRTRLNDDLPKWQGIADSINLIHTNPMYLIPGGQAFGRLMDRIDAGTVPGLTSVFDLFVDEHHLDARGNYFIACVMYAVIHGRSPVGLPNRLRTEVGNLYTEYPTEAQAAIMQEVAWQTVCAHPTTGVSCPNLPVELVDFSVEKTRRTSVEISWATLSETNNDFFQVERSADGHRFYPIQKIKGAGTTSQASTYEVRDDRPLSGTSYYRLKQVDYGGAFEYFDMLSINMGRKPNFVALRSKNIVTQNVQLELMDVNPLHGLELSLIATNGIVVKSELYGETLPNTSLEIDIRGLAAGLYYLQVKNGAEIFTRKIVIQE